MMGEVWCGGRGAGARNLPSASSSGMAHTAPEEVPKHTLGTPSLVTLMATPRAKWLQRGGAGVRVGCTGGLGRAEG